MQISVIRSNRAVVSITAFFSSPSKPLKVHTNGYVSQVVTDREFQIVNSFMHSGLNWSPVYLVHWSQAWVFP